MLFAVVLISVSATAQSKIAYVDSDEVIMAMPQFKKAQVTIEAFGKELAKVLDAKKAKLNSYYQGVADKVNKGQMSQLQQQTEDATIKKMQKDLQADAQKSDSDLSNKERELMKPIYEALNNALDKVSTANGYSYILEKKTILNFKNGIDATKKVKTALGL